MDSKQQTDNPRPGKRQEKPADSFDGMNGAMDANRSPRKSRGNPGNGRRTTSTASMSSQPEGRGRHSDGKEKSENVAGNKKRAGGDVSQAAGAFVGPPASDKRQRRMTDDDSSEDEQTGFDPRIIPLLRHNSPPNVEASTEGQAFVEDNDVLSGRGGGTNVHPGNRFFRDLINTNRRGYLKARKNDKPAISRTIVRTIRERGGRFLKRDEATGLWFEIGDEAAREKTSQALRQRAPEMRRILFESEREHALDMVGGQMMPQQQPPAAFGGYPGDPMAHPALMHSMYLQGMLPPPGAASGMIPPPGAASGMIPPPGAASGMIPPPGAASGMIPPPPLPLYMGQAQEPFYMRQQMPLYPSLPPPGASKDLLADVNSRAKRGSEKADSDQSASDPKATDV